MKTDFTIFVDQLRKALSNGLPGMEAQIQMAPKFREIIQLSRHEKSKAKQGSVLLLLYPVSSSRIYTVFIKRAKDGGSHSGQMALPGGKHDTDDHSFEHTALRETYEEIGIKPELISIIGRLSSLYIPVSNFWVLPVVGYLTDIPVFKINPTEVQKVIVVDINELICPENCLVKKINIHNVLVETPFFDVKGHHIWGATAMIVSEFLTILRNGNLYSSLQ